MTRSIEAAAIQMAGKAHYCVPIKVRGFWRATCTCGWRMVFGHRAFEKIADDWAMHVLITEAKSESQP